MSDMVGPNAVLQTLAAVERLIAPEARRAIVASAGLPADGAAPDRLVAAATVRRLNAAVLGLLGETRTRDVLREAGRCTGAYVLEHRIPPLARALLRHLPRTLAGHLLLGAIARHAWTFAGDAPVTVSRGLRRAVIAIAHNPLVATPCVWHEQVFERLFTSLLGGSVAVQEQACCGRGAEACRFEIAWQA